MSTLKVPVTPADHKYGNDDAPVTLVEYGDYECPHCAAAHPVVEALENYFNDRLRFVFRHFPLTEIHPHAEPAAETAELAGFSGRFWQMHNLIYENQQRLNLPTLIQLGQQLGLPAAEIERSVEEKTYQDKIQEDFIGGVRSGVNGTPTFFINGRKYNGSYALEDLISTIEQELMGMTGRVARRRY